MYCRNCGTELKENAGFCTQCGLKVHEEQIHKKIVIQKNKGIVAAIAIFLVIIFSLICMQANNVNSSPEKVAASIVKSEYEVNVKTMLQCFPDFTIREIAVNEGLSKNASHSEIIKEVKETYRYETPQKVKIISTEIVEEYDIEEYIIYRELYDYMTDEEYDSISKVAIVNVEFSVDGEEDIIQVACIKIKDKWYFLRGL